jgi:hypothetical protein
MNGRCALAGASAGGGGGGGGGASCGPPRAACAAVGFLEAGPIAPASDARSWMLRRARRARATSLALTPVEMAGSGRRGDAESEGACRRLCSLRRYSGVLRVLHGVLQSTARGTAEYRKGYCKGRSDWLWPLRSGRVAHPAQQCRLRCRTSRLGYSSTEYS